MLKKIFIFILLFLCFGCSNEIKVIKESNGESKTYSFFKNIDVNHYYISFWDRNVSKNDDTIIIMARSFDKYFYEIKGSDDRKIIQKDGIRYTIDESMGSYFKEKSDLIDYAAYIVPENTLKFKTLGYKTGIQKIYGFKYVFEQYNLNGGLLTYYYKGDDLMYVKYKSSLNETFLKFKSMKNNFSDNIFEISDDYNEMTY